MRILFAHCFYRVPGGEDRHVQEQVELVSGVHSVDTFFESNTELSHGPRTARRMLYSSAKKRQVLAAMDRFGPDVVHMHNVYPSLGPAVLLAAQERGVPVVMTVHNLRLRCPNGLMFTDGALCRRCESGNYLNALMHPCFPTHKQAGAYATILWIHRFVMRLDDRVARFIAPSEFVRSRLQDWGIAEERIRFVRHFVEPSTPIPHAKSGAYGLFLGRLSAEKGLPILLQALQRAGDPHFLIAGDGPLRGDLERLAEALALLNTRFLGQRPREEVPDLLAGARYVALPSISEEASPLAALEALSAGRPLLVTDRGALPEFVADGEGLTCRPGDITDLSDKLLRLMDDEVYRRASLRAARTARTTFTPEQHLASLEASYREVYETRSLT
jgi:glycosyltransferase involved in cell wall biosynthesis